MSTDKLGFLCLQIGLLAKISKYFEFVTRKSKILRDTHIFRVTLLRDKNLTGSKFKPWRIWIYR